MADWRIVTPTREPREDELGPTSSVRAIEYARTIFTGSSGIGLYEISYYSSKTAIRVRFPALNVYYFISDGVWADNLSGIEPIDITGVDLTIPEDEVNGAEIYPYFNLIAYEKGTTACKLAIANEAKTLIRNALINKGVDVPDTTPFRQYAGKVEDIQSGSNTEFIVFNVNSFNGTSEWYDESGNIYVSASYQIQGPYVFNHGTYQTIQDIRMVASGIFFSVEGSMGRVYLRVPNLISEGGSVYFIFENDNPSPLRLRMYVTFN